jgi:hypothetical protein
MPIINVNVFTSAFSGAMAGIVGGRLPGNTLQSAYIKTSSVAGAFAGALDSIWILGTATSLDLEIITDLSEAEFKDRAIDDSTSTDVSSYSNAAQTVLAAVKAARAYYIAQGITPPPAGGDSNFVKTYSDIVLVDTLVNTGDSITTINVIGLKAGEKVNISFNGSYYFGSGDAQIQLFVDGVAIVDTSRGLSQSTPNQFCQIGLIHVLEGLTAGDHTITIRNIGATLMFFFPETFPAYSNTEMIATITKT